MCDCINKLEEKWRKPYPDLQSISGQYELIRGRAYMNIEINFKNKKSKKIRVLFEYCPHCRSKIP